MPDDEIAHVPPNPLVLIQQAISRGMSVADLKELCELARQEKLDHAAARFACAITGFQAECPQIEKWKEGAKGAYKYAPYESIMAVVKPIVVKHGIVITFTTKQEEKGLLITCRIRVGTHSEETELFMPTPAGNNMINSAQNQGITLAYAKRNALKAALNIVERGEDADGDLAGDFLNAAQQAEVTGQFTKLKEIIGAHADWGRFMEWVGWSELKDVPQRELGRITTYLRDKLAAAQKGAKK